VASGGATGLLKKKQGSLPRRWRLARRSPMSHAGMGSLGAGSLRGGARREPKTHIALDASLTREAREFIPAPSGCYLLFDLAQRRDIGKSVQDLNTAGRAAAVAAALMEVWHPMADGDVKECLTPGDVFERDFVEVSDPWHDRFPGHSQIAAVSASLCLESAFRAMRPGSDFGATIMFPWITIGYSKSMAM
jgi:hypothetical protein